jgi:hypothetical protein
MDRELAERGMEGDDFVESPAFREEVDGVRLGRCLLLPVAVGDFVPGMEAVVLGDVWRRV